jgi:hypothetical protein
MSKLCLILIILAALVVGAGCKSSSGSKEYIPSKGWVPTD